MKNRKMNWAVILIGLTMLMLIPSILQFFSADLYIGIYTKALADLTFPQVVDLNGGLAKVLEISFQGMGLGVLGIHMFVWPILLIPYRKGEKWAWYTLGISLPLLWIGNFYLESQGNSGSFLILYSFIPITLIVISLVLSYRTVFRKE